MEASNEFRDVLIHRTPTAVPDYGTLAIITEGERRLTERGCGKGRSLISSANWSVNED
jgi:hypothetical protein